MEKIEFRFLVLFLFLFNISCYNPPENCEETFISFGGITDCFDPKLKESNINICLINLSNYQKCKSRAKKQNFIF